MIPRRIIVIIIPDESVEFIVMYDLLNADLTQLIGQLLAGKEG